jgi:hypothetical protein
MYEYSRRRGYITFLLQYGLATVKIIIIRDHKSLAGSIPPLVDQVQLRQNLASGHAAG